MVRPPGPSPGSATDLQGYLKHLGSKFYPCPLLIDHKASIVDLSYLLIFTFFRKKESMKKVTSPISMTKKLFFIILKTYLLDGMERYSYFCLSFVA